MNKIILVGITTLATLLISGCGNNTKSANSKSNNSKMIKKASSSSRKLPRPSANAKNRPWTYKDNVFDAGIETYTFTNYKIMDSVTKGKKCLVLYCNVRNNSNKEQTPSNIFMVVNAYQKNKTSDIQLHNGVVKEQDDQNSTLYKYTKNLSNKLLPGKTVKAVMVYELENNNPVKLEFQNSNFDTIGTKTYNMK